MNNLITSIIRTVVPVAIGTVITWLQIHLGLAVDDTTSASVVTTVTGFTIALYYVAIRWLEVRFPQVGWLLGQAKAPGYSPLPAPPARPSPGVNEDTGQGSLPTVAWVLVIIILVLVLLKFL
jgi:hypothetical protein